MRAPKYYEGIEQVFESCSLYNNIQKYIKITEVKYTFIVFIYIYIYKIRM